MSHFATPFIVVNLGCEMIYIIDQRLKSQNISQDKSERESLDPFHSGYFIPTLAGRFVKSSNLNSRRYWLMLGLTGNRMLTDIVTVLLHPRLLDELFIPQPVATHTVIRQLLQDISTTSIMKLDEYSMSKLWDLMTMIYKWQLSVTTSQNIFDISRRHLRSVSKLLPEYFSGYFIEETMKRFENLRQQFTDDDYKSLCNTLILWFSEYHTKISVLLRLGLQKKDGTFCLPSALNPKILKNLGENIYGYDNKKNSVEEYQNRCADTHEINCLLAPIENTSAKKSVIDLKLPIELDKKTAGKKVIKINKNIKFENISTVNVKNKDFNISYCVNIPKSTQQDLLEMLDNTSF